MSSWWDAVRDWFRSGRKGDFPEPTRETPDNVQHFTGREDWIRRRKNLVTGLGSREISEAWSAKIRAQAFFSARVEEAHILEELRTVSDAFTRGEIGQAEARTRLKEFLVSQGYDPQRGGLSNLASTGRLNLILEQNARMAYAVGRWQEGMDPDIKERFPCWRYVGSTSAAPRDSHARYAGHVYAKDDPIWHTIFPPSDFGCKCSVEDCDDPAEKAPEDVGPAESGFAFDPAHAFEEFDYDAIKDAALRERTREGVEKILKEGVWSDPSDRSDGSDKMPEPEPEAKPESKPATQSETKATQTLKPTPQLEIKPEKMPEARPSSIEHNAMKEARLREKIQAEVKQSSEKEHQTEARSKIKKSNPKPVRNSESTPKGEEKPAGKPVSSALLLKSKDEDVNNAVRRALAAIDTVHGDGELSPDTEIFGKSLRFGVHGETVWKPGGKYHISISTGASHKSMTALHELGHFLDFSGLSSNPKRGYTATEGNPLLKEWRDAVSQTKAYKEIESRIHSLEKKKRKSKDEKDDLKHLRYLFRKEEFFARGYAQYIATKCDDPLIKKELEKTQSSVYCKAFHTQWDDDDFKVLAEAYDNLFKAKGWIQ